MSRMPFGLQSQLLCSGERAAAGAPCRHLSLVDLAYIRTFMWFQAHRLPNRRAVHTLSERLLLS